MNHIEVVRQLWESQEYPVPKPISPKQMPALQQLFAQYTRDKEERLAWVSRLFGYPITTFHQLTLTQAGVLFDYAFPDCKLFELPVHPKFVALIDQLKEAPIEIPAF